METRRLTPADVVVYRKLMLGAYQLHPDAFTSSQAERQALPLSWWKHRLSEDIFAPQIVQGAFVNNQLAGVAGLLFETREKTRHKATLYGMYVDQKFRRRGIGRRLVEDLLAIARDRQLQNVLLTVTDGNQAAITLYEACGFRFFGVEPMAIQWQGKFFGKVHMVCRLQ